MQGIFYREKFCECCVYVESMMPSLTSAENNLTGIPNALAKPKSANFNSPFYI